MLPDRTTKIASLIVIATGVLWGFYWLPVRQMEALGLAGPWGTVAITAASVLFLMPIALRRWSEIRTAQTMTRWVLIMGGGAFALYSIGFIYGRVALVILLFFLTPIWSTLIARYIMGWQTPVLRYVAIGVGLLGLSLMLSAGGGMPVPKSLGEWFGLISGLCWSVTTTVLRAKSPMAPIPAAWLFSVGALVTSFVLALLLEPVPDGMTLSQLKLALGTGWLWWGASIAALLWATARLDPARVGILLMAEVVIGTAGAALLAGEILTPLEVFGGGLVLVAALLEVWPQKPKASEVGHK